MFDKLSISTQLLVLVQVLRSSCFLS